MIVYSSPKDRKWDESDVDLVSLFHWVVDIFLETILTGFWMVYFQLFTTLPVFIRDFVDTSDLVQVLKDWSPGLAQFLADANVEQLAHVLPTIAQNYHEGMGNFQELKWQLVNYKVMVPEFVLRSGLQALIEGKLTARALADDWAANYRQVNPEYIVNIGFGFIVLCQVVISAYLQRWRALPVLVFGTIILSSGIALCGLGTDLVTGGGFIALAVIIFSLGEMIASPKSQEYVAAIAPKNKTAMYMGYYFVSMALGNLFAGLLSGWSYSVITKEMQQQRLMWRLFAAIGAATACSLVIFNRWLSKLATSH
ncbi:hypothetical protein [Undibacterium fentianense]|uniref:Major facilitator superfamily (MFS) profile domain-containing protein n=1 Tax=Undibacterium fentianense TaxID=2828728 RepID=A0A941IGI2_9BURK|nr:hypothetical protein [Undibacterium fentianense]MBR7800025.1 hypothetical protein [Undibacterium fentianense]